MVHLGAFLASSLAFQDKQTSDPTELNPSEKPKDKLILVGSKSEAQTDYISSQYQPSYDFPWNPDSLVRGNNYKIYDEMRNDDQIKAVMSIKKDFVINTGWYIECAVEEIKDRLTDNLTNLDSQNGFQLSFDEILRDILSAYEYGFSLTEPILQLGLDNLWEYKTLIVRPPHTFQFEIDEKGTVVEVIQSTSTGDKPLNPQIFLHFAYQQEYGNPYGRSDLKAAHIPWKIKKFTQKFHAIYMEKYASPTLVGKYPNNYNTTDIDNFFSKLKTFQQDTVAVVPQDAQIDFVQNQRDASKVYIEALNNCNMQIARALLMPDLMGLSGAETSGGSYSLGKEQFRLFMNTIEKDRLLLEKKFTQRIIQPLVQANWGDYPAHFKFHPYSQTDEIEMSKIFKDLISTGKIKPTESGVKHIENLLRFPDDSLEVDDTPQPANPFNPQMGGEKPNGQEIQPKEETPQNQKVKEELSKMGEVKVFRKLTDAEKKLNFTEIANVLNQSDDRIAPKLKSAGKQIYNDLIQQVREKNILSDFKPEKLESVSPKFLRNMNVLFKRHFTDLFRKSLEEARKELFPNGDKKFVAEDILPDEFVEVIEAESFKTVGDYSTEITKKTKNIVMQGLKSGLSDAEISKQLREELEGVSDRWINTVVRTKTTEMYNAARKIYWDTDPLASQIVEAYQWSAILDDRTSQVCEYLDQKIFAKGDFIDRATPPIHFNCRSIFVPMTKFEQYETDDEPSVDKLIEMGGNLLV